MTANSFQIASIYAKAIIKLNLDASTFKQLCDEIDAVSKTQIFLLKEREIEKLPLSFYAKNLFIILTKSKKIFILKDLAKILNEHLLEIENAIEFEVATATAISLEEIESLKQSLFKKFNKKIIIKTTQDKSLLGGFTLKFSSFFADFSKKSKISQIKTCILK